MEAPIGKDRRQYTPSEINAIRKIAIARMNSEHNGLCDLCLDCVGWAEREFLINKVKERLDANGG